MARKKNTISKVKSKDKGQTGGKYLQQDITGNIP